MTTFPYPFNIMFPGAGGNMQSFDFWSPTISVNYAGDRVIEREVNEDVASFGSQIGWLNEIVIALAEAAPEVQSNKAAEAALKRLEAAQKKIDAIKKRRKSDAVDAARDALANLGAADKAAYGRLVRSLNPDQPPSAA